MCALPNVSKLIVCLDSFNAFSMFFEMKKVENLWIKRYIKYFGAPKSEEVALILHWFIMNLEMLYCLCTMRQIKH